MNTFSSFKASFATQINTTKALINELKNTINQFLEEAKDN